MAGGRIANWAVTVGKDGVLTIGSFYTRAIGADPGDRLRIEIDDDNCIRLEPTGERRKLISRKAPTRMGPIPKMTPIAKLPSELQAWIKNNQPNRKNHS